MGRIQIRPPRKEAPININDTWKNTLEPALQDIYSVKGGDFSKNKLSFKVLYDSIYRLVTQGHGRALLRKFTEATHDYLQTIPALAQNPQKRRKSEGISSINDETKEDSHVLEQVSSEWQAFQVSLRLVGDIFMYLNRSYCNDPGIPTTDQVGKQLFRDDIVKQALDPIFSQLLAQINKDRHGEPVNSWTLKSVTSMLKQLTEDEGENSPSIFDSRFRGHLITDAIRVYATHMKEMSQLPSQAQLVKIDEWMKNEHQLGLFYLPDEIRSELLSSLQTEVIEKGIPGILQKQDSGVVSWLSSGNLDALKLASELEMKGSTRTLVREVGSELVRNQHLINKNNADALSWVEESIKLRNTYIQIAETIGQDSWRSALSDTHKQGIADCTNASNLLALYLDEYLKKNPDIPNENVEPALDKALILHNSIPDRDEFSLIFQRLLARRLLNNSSRSREFEFSWLQRLKEENLNSDSLNFERMILNIDESRMLFHGSTSISPGIIPTNVNVLSMHLWPKSMQPQSQYPLVLPQTIAEAKAKFEDFYTSVKKDRILKWNYSLSNADMKVRVGEKAYHVSIPLVCASILTIFEGDVAYTTKELSLRTQIPLGGELERHLKSLYLAPGSELLLKSPPGKEVQPNDEFRFNNDFKSSKNRIKIKKIAASKQMADAANQETANILAQERSQKAEAAIVRIMKANKQLSHTELVERTSSLLQSHFKAPQVLIKRAIQDLLAKEYIEREHNNTEIYRYIA